MIQTLLSLALAGSAGVMIRYGCMQLFSLSHSSNATVLANGIGCLFLGAIIAIGELIPMPPLLRLSLIVGLCGALTTFSSIVFDIVNFLEKQEFSQALTYFIFTNILGVAMFGLGFIVVTKIVKTL